MAEPTDEQLREYAAKLPQIYRDIFAIFDEAAPERHRREALTTGTVVGEMLANTVFTASEIDEALELLVERDFLTRGHKSLPSLAPTELGERLLTAVTGHESQKRRAPPLPQPTWG